MSDDPNTERTALKEWAVLIDAMAHGDIIAMVRKGGIREQRAGFSVRHPRFLLYPTFFHEKVHELAPRFRDRLQFTDAQRPSEGMVRIDHVADALAIWTVTELDRLYAIEDEYGLSRSAVESRFHYRNRPVVQVIVVRVSTFEHPIIIPELRRYHGCVSWVNLDESLNVASATPVLDEGTLRSRLAMIDHVLGPPQRQALQG